MHKNFLNNSEDASDDELNSSEDDIGVDPETEPTVEPLEQFDSAADDTAWTSNEETSDEEYTPGMDDSATQTVSETDEDDVYDTDCDLSELNQDAETNNLEDAFNQAIQSAFQFVSNNPSAVFQTDSEDESF